MALHLTDEELNKPVVLELQETPVMWLLDLPGPHVRMLHNPQIIGM